MSQYLKHLTEMSGKETFQRKIDYLEFNTSSFTKSLKNKTSKVLEVGPGTGEFEAYLNKKKIYDIDIVDNDKSILNYVSNKFKIKNKILTNDISKINKKLRNYDLIFLMQVLEHIPISQYQKFVKTLFNHLNKEGVMIIIVPNANNPLGLIERYADLQHTSAFTTQSLKDLIDLANLKKYEIAIQGFEIPPFGIVNIIRKFLQKILHLFLLGIMVINGGLFFNILTPNIMLVIKKK